jgi:hypothetical protein
LCGEFRCRDYPLASPEVRSGCGHSGQEKGRLATAFMVCTCNQNSTD